MAQNLAFCFGPPLGGLLLLGDSWTRLYLGGFLLGGAAVAATDRRVASAPA